MFGRYNLFSLISTPSPVWSSPAVHHPPGRRSSTWRRRLLPGFRHTSCALPLCLFLRKTRVCWPVSKGSIGQTSHSVRVSTDHNNWQYHHLVFDLFGCVSEEDWGVGVTGAHLGLRPLQGWEEGGVQQGWFGMADPWSYITGHPEVGVLDEDRYKHMSL